MSDLSSIQKLEVVNKFLADGESERKVGNSNKDTVILADDLEEVAATCVESAISSPPSNVVSTSLSPEVLPLPLSTISVFSIVTTTEVGMTTSTSIPATLPASFPVVTDSVPATSDPTTRDSTPPTPPVPPTNASATT